MDGYFPVNPRIAPLIIPDATLSSFSETTLHFCQTTRRHIPEDIMSTVIGVRT